MDKIIAFLEEEIANREQEAVSIEEKLTETNEKIRLLREIRKALSQQENPKQPDYKVKIGDMERSLNEARKRKKEELFRQKKDSRRWKAKISYRGIYVDGNWVNSFELSAHIGNWLYVQRSESGIDVFSLRGRYLLSIDIPTNQELDWSEAIRRIQVTQKG